MKGTGYRGIFTIDALVTLIPIMIIAYIGITSFSMRAQATNSLYQDNAMLNLVEVSDYMIRKTAVCENSMCHMNWINGIEESKGYYTGFSPLESSSCIYRIVNYQTSDDIRKLYFCKR
ncbi:MAG: hypothetical protein NTY68_04210 [Candidatus Micrarchaeota archaeon]|nr:hypothetical protein [Candidatus Micrarchaeota archaeon]